MVGKSDSESGNTDDEETERIVVANGMDFDKRYFYEVTKRMSRDWDLRKLSLFGPPIWVVASVLAGYLSVNFLLPDEGIPTPAGISSTALDGIPSIPTEQLSFVATAVVVVAAIAWLLKPIGGLSLTLIVNWLAGVYDSIKTILRYSANLLNVATRDVWQNLNYWHPFTTHLSGRDPLVVLRESDDVSISGIYSDEPHYNNVFVDTIYIEPEGDLSLKQRLTVFLYGGGPLRKWLVTWGLLPVVAAAALVVVFEFDAGAAASAVPSGSRMLTAGLLVVGGVSTVVLAAVAISDATAFNVRFRADSAGLSRYQRLLNEPESESPLSKGRRSLSNSMSGYGLLYLSRYLADIFGRKRYDVTFDSESLLAVEAEDEQETEDEDETDESSENGPTLTNPQGHGALTDSHATAAASELLWSSIPPESVRTGGENPDITLGLNGVSYHETDELPKSWIMRRRVVRWLINYDPESYWGDTVELLRKRTAGDRTGLRIPIKKFMSVRHDLPVETIQTPENPANLLFFADSKADLWNDDTVHSVFLGGGEHQQGINKLVLALKSEGFDNVDVLENAFSADVSDGTDDLRAQLRRRASNLGDVMRSIRNGESATDDGDEELLEALEELAEELGRKPTESEVEATDDLSLTDLEEQFGSLEAAMDAAELADNDALFPTEYFVSFVGAEESFRQKDHGFVLFRHRLETDGDQTRWAHVIIGMSAVATKAGMLYWDYLFKNGFEDPENDEFGAFEEDVIHFVSCPGPIDFEAVDDIGDLYLDTSWQEHGGLGFSVTRDEEYDSVPRQISEEPSGIKKLGMSYYELDITDAPLGS